MNKYLEKIALDIGAAAKTVGRGIGNVFKRAIGGHERQYVADNILKTTRVDKINDFVSKLNGPNGKKHLVKTLMKQQNKANYKTTFGMAKIQSRIADKHLSKLNELHSKKTGARMAIGAVGVAGYATKKKYDQHKQEQYPQVYYDTYQRNGLTAKAE